MSADASAAARTEIRYDTAESALGRRAVELVRSTQDHPVRWTIRLVLAGRHHEVTFAGLKSRPLDLPAALSRHLAGFTGDEELVPEPQGGRPERDGSDSIAKGSDAPAALTAMLQRLSDQLLVGDLAVRLDLPDAIHQLRVTCRSMRALLGAAAPFLERSPRREANLRLKTLARACAPARDAEVTAQLLPVGLESFAAVNRDSVTLLQERALVQYREQARAVRRFLQQKEHHELLMDVEAFARNPPLTDKTTDLTARQLANKLLRRSLRGVRDSAVQAPDDTLSPEDRALHRAHDVRKAAKKVRYVSSALHHTATKPRKNLRRAARTARRYQRELGAVIDSSVVLEWLSHTADADAGKGDRYELGLIQGVTAGRYQDSVGRSDELIDKFLVQLAEDWPAS